MSDQGRARFDMYERQRYAAADQFLLQVPGNARRRIIYPGRSRARVQHYQCTMAAPSTRSRTSAATSSKGRLSLTTDTLFGRLKGLDCLQSFSISRAREEHSRYPRGRSIGSTETHGCATTIRRMLATHDLVVQHAFQMLTTNADMPGSARRRGGAANALMKRGHYRRCLIQGGTI